MSHAVSNKSKPNGKPSGMSGTNARKRWNKFTWSANDCGSKPANPRNNRSDGLPERELRDLLHRNESCLGTESHRTPYHLTGEWRPIRHQRSDPVGMPGRPLDYRQYRAVEQIHDVLPVA